MLVVDFQVHVINYIDTVPDPIMSNQISPCNRILLRFNSIGKEPWMNLPKISLRFLSLLLSLAISNALADKLYTWTDEKGHLHITDEPPPHTAKVRDVIEYAPRSLQELNAIHAREEKRSQERQRDSQSQQKVLEAKRRAEDAEIRAKEAVQHAEEVTRSTQKYIWRLGSTIEKKRRFRKRIQALEKQIEAAQAQAREAVEQAKIAAEAARIAEEEAGPPANSF
ncbi:MAG: DUF4124 domain-containing protein [Desulfobacterales bacterium]|nr:MAG: DUF4124 domain-containing protein [Desulfobacterales bacterium]